MAVKTVPDEIDAEIARFRAKGATMAELRPGFKGWITQRGLEVLLPPLDERRRLGDRLERRFRRGTHDSIADFHRLREAGRVRLVQGHERLHGGHDEWPLRWQLLRLGLVQLGLRRGRRLLLVHRLRRLHPPEHLRRRRTRRTAGRAGTHERDRP